MSNKSIFSLLLGLAAGAALGILYAPDKGEKTRARVKKAAENGLDELETILSTSVDEDEEVAEEEAEAEEKTEAEGDE